MKERKVFETKRDARDIAPVVQPPKMQIRVGHEGDERVDEQIPMIPLRGEESQETKQSFAAGNHQLKSSRRRLLSEKRTFAF